jgi:hypothetical protein
VRFATELVERLTQSLRAPCRNLAVVADGQRSDDPS